MKICMLECNTISECVFPSPWDIKHGKVLPHDEKKKLTCLDQSEITK